MPRPSFEACGLDGGFYGVRRTRDGAVLHYSDKHQPARYSFLGDAEKFAKRLCEDAAHLGLHWRQCALARDLGV